MGINFGNRYNKKAVVRKWAEDLEGVFYSEQSKKWVVRIKKENGKISAVAQFAEKSFADQKYLELKKCNACMYFDKTKDSDKCESCKKLIEHIVKRDFKK